MYWSINRRILITRSIIIKCFSQKLYKTLIRKYANTIRKVFSLIENAVKHNVFDDDNPLEIDIVADEKMVRVKNRILKSNFFRYKSFLKKSKKSPPPFGEELLKTTNLTKSFSHGLHPKAEN